MSDHDEHTGHNEIDPVEAGLSGSNGHKPKSPRGRSKGKAPGTPSEEVQVATAREEADTLGAELESTRTRTRGSRAMERTRAFRRQRDISPAAKLDDDVITQIAQSMAHGNYLETAAAYAGVQKATIYNWMRRGRDELRRVDNGPGRKVKKAEELHVDLLYAVEYAQAEAAQRDLQNVSFAADYLGDWRASAWRMERRYPEQWGRREHQTVQHEGSGGGPVTFVQVAPQDVDREDGDVVDTGDGTGEDVGIGE